MESAQCDIDMAMILTGISKEEASLNLWKIMVLKEDILYNYLKCERLKIHLQKKKGGVKWQRHM